MQRVCILSKDPYFSRALALELDALVAVSIWAGQGELPIADTYLWDMDSIPLRPETEGRVISMAWNKEKPKNCTDTWLDRPFRPARLRAVLGLYSSTDQEISPYPVHSRQSVLLAGEEVPLTAVEFRLFCCLYEAKGQYLTREELHRRVWDEEGDAGVVNVYIHYLRQKLEKNGQKLFYSARGRGYGYFTGKEGAPKC